MYKSRRSKDIDIYLCIFLICLKFEICQGRKKRLHECHRNVNSIISFSIFTLCRMCLYFLSRQKKSVGFCRLDSRRQPASSRQCAAGQPVIQQYCIPAGGAPVLFASRRMPIFYRDRGTGAPSPFSYIDTLPSLYTAYKCYC